MAGDWSEAERRDRDGLFRDARGRHRRAPYSKAEAEKQFIGNDPIQAKAARRVVDENEVLVSDTVWMETDWVLRSAYGFSRSQVCKALRDFAGLPHIIVERPDRLARALTYAETGMDFADGLHLASADGCAAFVTFDTRLQKAARKVEAIEVRLP